MTGTLTDMHEIHISGAGPAGLAAALTIQNSGRQAVVHELNGDVGARFHDDSQGIENWSTDGDVLDELSAAGIEAEFEHVPYRDMVIFAPDGREHRYNSVNPIFYLVRRGQSPGTLDEGLKHQALAAGALIHFHDPVRHFPHGGIVAEGPHGADAIAVGYIFNTDMADGVYAAVSDHYAPKGYSYLIIHQGRATVAACFFEDFHNEKQYLERTVELFERKVAMKMKDERRFGGTGNFLVPRTARKGNILFAGEAAGFQDALWGFGMRYAMVSGHLAARALLAGTPKDYDRMWRRRLGGRLRTGFVNRLLFERLGDAGYRGLLRRADRSEDVRAWLGTQYASTLWKSLFFPVAHRAIRSRRKEAVCPMEGCDCTWCRCAGHESSKPG